jgi:hypothetical protein
MHLVLIFFISALGLGHLLMKLIGLQGLWGFRAALGYCLIPLSVFVLHMTFGLDLRTAARVTFLAACIGFLYLLFDTRLKIKELSLHPLFTWGIPLTIFFFIFGPTEYIPTGTDEFSHWLTMPKQMFLENALLSPNFLVKDFASYTPGWPILLIYADLVLSKAFNYSEIIYVVFFSSIVCLSAIYDYINDYFDDVIGPLHKNLALVIMLIGSLVLLKVFAPKNILIETPMYHGILLFFLTTALLLKKEGLNSWFYLLSIVTAYCYLLKHAFLTLIILLPFILFFSARTDIKKTFFRALILLTPFALLYLTWKDSYSSLNIPELFPPNPINSIDQLKIAFAERIGIFQKLPTEILNILKRLSKPAVIGFLSFFLFRSLMSRRMFSLILLYFFAYLASLVWMYFTGFGIYEALILASFERYMSVPLLPILLFGGLSFFKWVCIKHSTWHNSPFKKFQNLLTYLPILCLALFLTDIKVEIYKNITFPVHPMIRDFGTLKKLLLEKKLDRPDLLVVAQGGKHQEFQLARFLAVGDEKYYFNLLTPETTFSETQDDVWRSVKTIAEMIALLRIPQIIWVVESDPWMNNLFQSFLNEESCKPPYEQYFIVRTMNTFECVRKQPIGI